MSEAIEMGAVDFFLGVGFTVACVIAFITATATLEQDYPEAISFTVIDHDASDNSVYTSDGAILFTNHYQWKRLELNKTYVCDKATFNHFSDCHAVATQPTKDRNDAVKMPQYERGDQHE